MRLQRAVSEAKLRSKAIAVCRKYARDLHRDRSGDRPVGEALPAPISFRHESNTKAKLSQETTETEKHGTRNKTDRVRQMHRPRLRDSQSIVPVGCMQCEGHGP